MIQPDAIRGAIGNRTLFLLLICTQAAHSAEEILFKLYDVFTPARAASAMFSADPRTGFAIGNVLLVTFGFWCYFRWVRPARQSAPIWMWGWTILEAANGVGHMVIAFTRGRYFPGVFTAPALLGLSLVLALRLLQAADE